MPFVDELKNKVTEIFQSSGNQREGRVVPVAGDVRLGDDAVLLNSATVLYADIAGSTQLVDGYQWWFAGEIYKSYLYCAARIIGSEGGQITAYDGDRIMGIFVGETHSANAVRAALKITFAVQEIINTGIKIRYPSTEYSVRQVVGIDTSPIRAARTGVRGDNDLVWIGKAANHAAKLTELDLGPTTWITQGVFDQLSDDTKYGGTNRELMWKTWNWTQMNNVPIYSSTWRWTV